MDRVTVYTDGASSGNPGPSGWAFYMNGELVSGSLAIATNNQMEMLAILHAVKACPRAVELHIVSDSKIALGMVCRGWRGKNEALQDIRDQIHRQAFLKCVRLSCALVKGHAGHRENTLTDERARLEAKREKSRQLASK